MAARRTAGAKSYNDLEHEAKELRTQLAEANQRYEDCAGELTATQKQLSDATVALKAAQEQAATADERAVAKAAQSLEQAAAQPAAVAGPAADDPRWLYEAAEMPQGQVFPNLAAERAAKKAQPNFWFRYIGDAQAAWERQVADDAIEKAESVIDNATV